MIITLRRSEQRLLHTAFTLSAHINSFYNFLQRNNVSVLKLWSSSAVLNWDYSSFYLWPRFRSSLFKNRWWISSNSTPGLQTLSSWWMCLMKMNSYPWMLELLKEGCLSPRNCIIWNGMELNSSLQVHKVRVGTRIELQFSRQRALHDPLSSNM
jgi:hypothetical protein